MSYRYTIKNKFAANPNYSRHIVTVFYYTGFDLLQISFNVIFDSIIK